MHAWDKGIKIKQEPKLREKIQTGPTLAIFKVLIFKLITCFFFLKKKKEYYIAKAGLSICTVLVWFSFLPVFHQNHYGSINHDKTIMNIQ